MTDETITLTLSTADYARLEGCLGKLTEMAAAAHAEGLRGLEALARGEGDPAGREQRVALLEHFSQLRHDARRLSELLWRVRKAHEEGRAGGRAGGAR